MEKFNPKTATVDELRIYIKDLETKISDAVENIIKEVVLPLGIEFNCIDIQIFSIKTIGDQFNRYRIGKAQMDVNCDFSF